MPFPFSEVCTLLDRLEENELGIPTRIQEQEDRARSIIETWCKSHQRRISELSIEGVTALLSTLLPEWRTDRVYGAQSTKLAQVLKRSLGLRNSSIVMLDAHKSPGKGDLATCLSNVLQSLGKPALPAVCVEEVDEMLHEWAGLSTFSDPSVPSLPCSSSGMRDETFGYILKRLEHKNGKWILRLILKDFSPVKIDEHTLLRGFHFLLPDLLKFQRDFRSAVTTLKTQLREYPEHPDIRSERIFRRQVDVRASLRPLVGTKVGRPKFNKAWSLEYCLKVVAKDDWIVERKYDGEYCEIHVDMNKSQDLKQCIKILSKSGKDSTHDRGGILDILVECLRLGTDGCKFKRHAILLGELVVWSDRQQHVLDFSEIRKHVTRSGRLLGTSADSQPKADEHLAIVFFDILLLDDEIVMNKPVEERRLWLRESYQKIRGKAMSAEWKQINFADPESKKRLIQQFGASNASRCEGLILKPCGLPYYSIDTPNRSYLKLKKDYVAGLGDECDFAVIGGSYSSKLATTSKIKNVKWTSFHLGCSLNKEDVRRTNARPVFKYVWTIDCGPSIPAKEFEAANLMATFVSHEYDKEAGTGNFDVRHTAPLKMDHAFYPPLVFEVLGSGYQKPSNCSFQMLRHPRVKKMHQDRTWLDCVGFEELQQLAVEADTPPCASDTSETIKWIERVERSCKTKLDRDGTLLPGSRRSTSPRSSGASSYPQASPPRASSRRQNDALPTSLPSSSAPRLLSSPTVRSPVLQLTRHHGKRKSDNCQDVEPDHIKKKVRRSAPALRLPGPASSPPLVEISNNALLISAQITARLCRVFDAGATARSLPAVKAHVQFESQPDYQLSTARCAKSSCPFANAVVYMAPCIANTPYIMENLLQLHHITTAPNLKYWDRDSFAHGRLTETVSESQAYPGMYKIVLVEGRRHAAVRDVVREITSLSKGRFRERVDVYDWRVLEGCIEHDRGADQVKRHFLGATLFDDTQRRALFVSERDWLDV